MSQYLYDHNTAHILEPVQGYDIVSFMNFWAPLSDKVLTLNAKTGTMAVPGTVMHRNAQGELEPGCEGHSMPQFLYAKQDSEDVLQSPVTANGQNITGVGIMSYGGFNTAPYQTNYPDGDYTGENNSRPFYGNGIASNAPRITDYSNPVISIAKQKSAFTTFPGACGLEFGSSEFARFKYAASSDPAVNDMDLGTNACAEYEYDCALTSPEPVATATDGAWGTKRQQLFGGFLKPGKYYKDNVCGVLSQKPFRNENGTWMIRFWACHKPALDMEELGITTSDTTIPTKLSDLEKDLKLSDLSDVTVTGADNKTITVAFDETSGEGALSVPTT